MREMKDSGLKWVGEIPTTWNVCKVKYVATSNTEVLPENFDSDTEIDYIEIGSVTYEGGVNSTERMKFENAPSRARRMVHEGDTIISTVRTYLKAIAYIDYTLANKIASTGFSVISPRKGVNNKYIYYALSTHSFISDVEAHSVGISYPAINNSSLMNLKFVIPSTVEQKRIADYLDSKCSKLDEIIEKQQAIIEKLKEYKLSVITEVVTKGLNANAEMKDSGVEWLGKYPAHWQYLSFKNVLLERNEKNIPVKTEERLSLSIDKGVTLYAEKTTNLDRFKDDVSQYKLAHEGDLVLNSMNMIVGAVGVSEYFGCVSPAYYTYYDTEEDHITTKYCEYLLRCKTMRKVLYSLGKGIMSIDRGDDKINTCRLKVSRNDLRALKIPVPPVEEQRDIVKYLVHKEQIIDKTISDREYAIAKLQEYKKSLIYEVVTGKKEV